MNTDHGVIVGGGAGAPGRHGTRELLDRMPIFGLSGLESVISTIASAA